MEEVASRYGLALFSLASDLKKIDDYQSEMKEWEKIFKENSEFLNVLSSSFLSISERQKIFKDTCKGMEDNILSFFLIIIENNRVGQLLDIIAAFNSYCNNSKGIKEGIVYSIEPLKEDQLLRIQKKISEIEKMEVYLRNSIDKSLIGGIKVVIGDRIYDDSIKHHISELKTKLLNKEGV